MYTLDKNFSYFNLFYVSRHLGFNSWLINWIPSIQLLPSTPTNQATKTPQLWKKQTAQWHTRVSHSSWLASHEIEKPDESMYIHRKGRNRSRVSLTYTLFYIFFSLSLRSSCREHVFRAGIKKEIFTRPWTQSARIPACELIGTDSRENSKRTVTKPARIMKLLNNYYTQAVEKLKSQGESRSDDLNNCGLPNISMSF